MQKITPFLWFNDNAEEAAEYYVSIFKNSRIKQIAHYGDAGPGPKGSVMTVHFQLEGQDFLALNGGPQFSFTPAISLSVEVKTQKEIDELWNKLSKGGKKLPCGWVEDKFGLSWQVGPQFLREHAEDPNVMKAMLGMHKLDLDGLKRAAELTAKEQRAARAKKPATSRSRRNGDARINAR